MVEDASINVMRMMTAHQRAALKAMGTEVPYPAGETIFREGEPSLWVLLIQKGTVKITSTIGKGTEAILAIRGVDELMGDEGVLMKEPRAATVTTISEVLGLVIERDDFVRFIEDQRLWPLMYQAAVRRRRQQDQRVMLARLDVKSRLARWLLELAAEVGQETADGWVIESTLSQRDFADRIGASRDAVAIELRMLRRHKIISTGRRVIILHDLEALRRISLV